MGTTPKRKFAEVSSPNKCNAKHAFQLEREICFIMNLFGGKILI
jgi:hypothetical protein